MIDGRPGTTVDGTVCTDPAFVAQLEEHHAAVGSRLVLVAAAATPHEDPH